jgi:hypothetical protein
MLKNTKYRSTIVSQIPDLAAPNTEKYKVQINYRFKNVRPFCSLLPILKNTKYRSTIVSQIPDLAAPNAEKYKVQINYCFKNARPLFFSIGSREQNGLSFLKR